jgi:hypothetical protein
MLGSSVQAYKDDLVYNSVLYLFFFEFCCTNIKDLAILFRIDKEIYI